MPPASRHEVKPKFKAMSESDTMIMVPMRDGVRLATDVHLPKGDGPFPTILVKTPYNFNKMGGSTLMFANSRRVTEKVTRLLNEGQQRDGWHLDDVEIFELPVETASYPFLDDVEDEALSRPYWIGSHWSPVITRW